MSEVPLYGSLNGEQSPYVSSHLTLWSVAVVFPDMSNPTFYAGASVAITG